MTRVIEWIAGLGEVALVAIAFLLAFAESAIFADLFIPGEVGIVLVGAALAENDSSMVASVAAAATGAFAGDCVSYGIGRRFGRGVVRHLGSLGRRLEPKIDEAERRFQRRGGWLVFAARWVGALRAVVPLVVGTAKMPFGRFAAFAAPAALLWSAVMIGLGSRFGRRAAEFIDRHAWWLSIAVLAGLAIWYLARRARRTSSRSGERRTCMLEQDRGGSDERSTSVGHTS
jgi:membrane protein DedA with SNARE-associated domain